MTHYCTTGPRGPSVGPERSRQPPIGVTKGPFQATRNPYQATKASLPDHKSPYWVIRAPVSSKIAIDGQLGPPLGFKDPFQFIIITILCHKCPLLGKKGHQLRYLSPCQAKKRKPVGPQRPAEGNTGLLLAHKGPLLAHNGPTIVLKGPPVNYTDIWISSRCSQSLKYPGNKLLHTTANFRLANNFFLQNFPTCIPK